MCSEENFGQEVDEIIYYLPKRVQGELVTIYGDTVGKGYVMFEIVLYLSIFYCLCFLKYKSTGMVGEQVMEDTDPYLKGYKDIRFSDNK